MKNLLITTVFFLFSVSAFSLDLKVSLWEKEICEAQKLCLPKAIGKPQLLNLPEPANNSFSRLTTRLDSYEVTFTFTKRTEPQAYYSFQVEIGTDSFPILALCSRYEGLDTLENAIVGACAAKIPLKNKMIGVSLQLPH